MAEATYDEVLAAWDEGGKPDVLVFPTKRPTYHPDIREEAKAAIEWYLLLEQSEEFHG